MEVKEWKVCSASWVNVLLEMPSLGYGLHGHDVLVEACLKAERKGLLVFDIEVLKKELEEILEKINRRKLSKILGSNDSSLEDLALYVCNELILRLSRVGEISVRVSVPNGSVEVTCYRKD